MKTAFVILAMVAGVAYAGRKAGVTMPDTVVVANKTLYLNGMGLREATWLRIDVYVAGLYLERVSSDPVAIVREPEVKRLVLRFVRDVDHDDIVKAWHEGFAANSTVPVSKLRPFIDQLDAWTPSFEDGDTLAFTYVPGDGVSVDYNGVRRGVVRDEDFARSLFAIWLGPKPPTGAVKRGLLGDHR